ncbi:hypothetical protein BLNAU_23593 [Blattamonas nauphoetae]|uniref:Uncharacterized protein n=1 Tax=Blattamonas nauphoetae TaxID=2049346 RepID=A0ABQ9WPT3_9EUKA|nr:hypothetical protein BLNAU_23593 [Blattamonas nauphoetae]
MGHEITFLRFWRIVVGISKICHEFPKESVLDGMEQRLINGFWAAQKRLKPFLDCLEGDDRAFVDFEEDSFEIRCVEDDALLAQWNQSLLIPWVMKDARVKAQRLLGKCLPSKALQQHERWVLIAGMMVHAPISKSDKDSLKLVVDKIPNDTSREELLSLVNHYSDEMSWNNPAPWTQTLDNIRKGGSLKQSDVIFLRKLFSNPAPELGNTEDLVNEIKLRSDRSTAQETMIALVCGYPRLSADLRDRINPKLHALSEAQQEDFKAKIKAPNHSDEDKFPNHSDEDTSPNHSDEDTSCLLTLVNGGTSLTLNESTKLNKLIASSTLSEEEKKTLYTQVFRTLFSSSDTMLVWNDSGLQISTTRQNITDMFQSFRDKKILESLDPILLKDEMKRIRSRITETQLLLFERLKGNRFSRKDYTGLLCCPNGGQLPYLPALDTLFPDPQSSLTGPDEQLDDDSDDYDPELTVMHPDTPQPLVKQLCSSSYGIPRKNEDDVDDANLPTLRKPAQSEHPH